MNILDGWWIKLNENAGKVTNPSYLFWINVEHKVQRKKEIKFSGGLHLFRETFLPEALKEEKNINSNHTEVVI